MMASIDKDEPKKSHSLQSSGARTSLKTHLKRGLIIFIVIKILMSLQNVVYQKPVFDNLANNFTLEDIYDDDKARDSS